MSDKSSLKNAYMNAAKKQIKQSNKSYDQAISQQNANALSRGMGRSSYALATSANLENEKLNAAKDIKSSANDAFIQAWLSYKQQQDQLQLQRDRFEWEKSQAAAAAAGGGGRNYSPNTNGTDGDTDTNGNNSYLSSFLDFLGNGFTFGTNANTNGNKNIWAGLNEYPKDKLYVNNIKR